MTEIEDPTHVAGEPNKDGIPVKINTGLGIKILLGDILYLKAIRDYTSIVTAKEGYLKTCQLGKLLEKIEPSMFLRVHKSYAINIGKVEGRLNGCIVVSGIKIPIGRTYKAVIYSYFGWI